MFSARLSASAAILLAAALGPVPAAAPDPVLLLVPDGARFAAVESARAGVPDTRVPLLVSAAEKISLPGGLSLLSDRTFARAPEADLLVVVPGPEDPRLTEFLRVRRGSARAILFLEDSPLARDLKAGDSRGAVILIGEVDAIATLVSAGAAPTPAPAGRPSASAPPTVAPPPAPPPSPGPERQTPAARSPTPGAERRAPIQPAPTKGVFDRYFSRTRPAPTATPTPPEP